MIDFIYKTLASLGYTHPLHPVLVHIPMGMVIGGFLFRLFSLKWKNLEKTAHNCFMLALIFVPFTGLLGVMDWQHRMLGQWINLIIAKFILAGVLFLLLSLTLYLQDRKKTDEKIVTLLYVLCLITVIVIGFIGGQLVYG